MIVDRPLEVARCCGWPWDIVFAQGFSTLEVERMDGLLGKNDQLLMDHLCLGRLACLHAPMPGDLPRLVLKNMPTRGG